MIICPLFFQPVFNQITLNGDKTRVQARLFISRLPADSMKNYSQLTQLVTFKKRMKLAIPSRPERRKAEISKPRLTLLEMLLRVELTDNTEEKGRQKVAVVIFYGVNLNMCTSNYCIITSLIIDKQAVIACVFHRESTKQHYIVLKMITDTRSCENKTNSMNKVESRDK